MTTTATTETTITTVRFNRDARSNSSFRVYTDGKAREIADREYFTKHAIHTLAFKCASWSRVGGFAANIEATKAAAAIEARWGVKVELKFSAKAGCSCGCSPGFVGKIVSGDLYAMDSKGEQLGRRDVHVDVPVTAEDEASIVAFAAKQAAKLPAEIVAGNAKVAAEQAAREEEKRQRELQAQARRDRMAQLEAKWANQAADESLLCAAL